MSLPVVGKAHEAKAASAPFHWFIYGSSLDRGAFATWAEHHGYRVPDFSSAVPARLDGFRIAFDIQSKFWGGAVASLAEESGGFVEGVALPMPADARGLVDHKEGAISGLYVAQPVQVKPLAGGPAIAALAFRGSAERRMTTPQTPSPGFVETLIKGAREFGLSEEWQKTLETLRR